MKKSKTGDDDDPLVEPMAEVWTRVRTIRVTAKHVGCGGMLTHAPSGEAVDTYGRYRHKCDICRKPVLLWEIYPRIEYEDL